MRTDLLGLGTAALASVLTRHAPIDLLATGPSHFAKLDGMRIHYKVFGSGRQNVVLVHGWACDMSCWRFQIPSLAPNTRTLVVDLPGHGQSDKLEVSYTPNLGARALRAVLDDAQVNRAVLVGHSNGVPVIRKFYRLYPARTAGLVVVEGTLRTLGDPAQYQRFADRLRGPNYKDVASKIVDGMFGPKMPGPLRAEIKAIILSTPQHVMVGALSGLSDPETWAPDPITVPLLLILAKSPFWTPDYEAFVRTLAPTADYRVQDGVGHFLMMETPEVFNEAILGFLSRPELNN